MVGVVVAMVVFVFFELLPPLPPPLPPPDDGVSTTAAVVENVEFVDVEVLEEASREITLKLYVVSAVSPDRATECEVTRLVSSVV